jgi:hypothetical protein
MKSYLLAAVVALLGLSACQKESDYYFDSGLANPYFSGTTVDYLNSQPFYFDSVSAIVGLAGLEDVLTSDTVTFFAPTDRSVQRLIETANQNLYALGYDTIRTLQDVPQNIWRKYLSRYIFKGANQLKDYPQVDYDILANYPGQGYLSWDGTPMNIGVVYGDVNNVKYVGYRQLSIAYIPDVSEPTSNWDISFVASCNILTDNGVVHVLDDNHIYFGFEPFEFIQDLEAAFAGGLK